VVLFRVRLALFVTSDWHPTRTRPFSPSDSMVAFGGTG
jgi:hypothetical protein